MPVVFFTVQQRSALDSSRDEPILSEKEMALRNALLGTLQALKSSRGASLDHRDVLLALNALGQIARAWDWLGSGRPVEECKQDLAELEQCAMLLCELAHHELKLLDARQIAGKFGDGFTTRDFALMLLALARIARRLRNSSVKAVLPGFAQELCSRLELAAEHRDQPGDLSNLKEITLEASASLSAASLMLMHCAKDAVHGAGPEQMNHSPSVPLAVIMAWSKTALHLEADVRQESFKALAAATTMVMQQLSENTPLDTEGLKKSTDTLQFLLQFATGTANMKDVQLATVDMSEMDNWHLDSCLQALAVLDTLNEMTKESLDSSDKLRSRLLYLETCVIVEATSPTRLPKLQENNVAFWLRLLDSRLANRVATKLAFQLHECPAADRKKLPVAVRASLRDFLFFVEKNLFCLEKSVLNCVASICLALPTSLW